MSNTNEKYRIIGEELTHVARLTIEQWWRYHTDAPLTDEIAQKVAADLALSIGGHLENYWEDMMQDAVDRVLNGEFEDEDVTVKGGDDETN